MARNRFTTFKAWGGFVDGKLYLPQKICISNMVYDERRYAIFPTRREARTAYEDVRRIEVTIKEKPHG